MGKEETYTTSFCPECGWKVAVDEDGLCLGCGNTAVGERIEELGKKIAELEEDYDRVSEKELVCKRQINTWRDAVAKANGKIIELKEENKQPRLGSATTKELLDEIYARIEVDGMLGYSTVNGENYEPFSGKG